MLPFPGSPAGGTVQLSEPHHRLQGRRVRRPRHLPACHHRFNAQDYRSAQPLFDRSAKLAKADDVRLSSWYFEALCLEKLDRRDESAPVYEDIAAIATNNPYRDEARLALAHLAMADKHLADAFKQYEALSREATKPALQADASLKAGLLARDLNQPETAAALFTRATNLAGASAAVRADAMIAQLHLLYDTTSISSCSSCTPRLARL